MPEHPMPESMSQSSAEPGPLPPAPVVRPWTTVTALALVWTAAAVPVVSWLVHQGDPELAVRGALRLRSVLAHGCLGLTVLAAVLLVFYPPFPAWLRLAWHRVRLAVTSDRGPLLRALSELRHFESAQRHLEIGRLALQLGDLSLAGPHLQRAVALDASLPGAHYQFGRLLLRLGELPLAIEAFTRAESLDPGHAFGDALLHAGRCLYLVGDSQRAADVLRVHSQRHGGGRRSGYWLAEALLAAGDRDGAAAAFATTAAPSPQPLTAEENWFRARARVRLWRRGGRS